MEKIYALYKGDEFIDLGTKEYLAKKLNVDKKTIDFYTSKVYKKRRKDDGKSIIIIKIEDD